MISSARAYPGFRNIVWLEVFVLPLSQGLTPDPSLKFFGTHLCIYTPRWREALLWVESVFPKNTFKDSVRTATRTVWPRAHRANHWATTPLTLSRTSKEKIFQVAYLLPLQNLITSLRPLAPVIQPGKYTCWAEKWNYNNLKKELTIGALSNAGSFSRLAETNFAWRL